MQALTYRGAPGISHQEHVNIERTSHGLSCQRCKPPALSPFLVGALVVFVIFLLAFRTILLPFVAGMALAYFLDPVADWLERRGLSRSWQQSSFSSASC